MDERDDEILLPPWPSDGRGDQEPEPQIDPLRVDAGGGDAPLPDWPDRPTKSDPLEPEDLKVDTRGGDAPPREWSDDRPRPDATPARDLQVFRFRDGVPVDWAERAEAAKPADAERSPDDGLIEVLLRIERRLDAIHRIVGDVI